MRDFWINVIAIVLTGVFTYAFDQLAFNAEKRVSDESHQHAVSIIIEHYESKLDACDSCND